MLSKKEVAHLAALSRMEIDDREQEKLLHDLEGILNYFEELKEISTENIPPVTGGTHEQNVTRDDVSDVTKLSGERAVESFPEFHNHFLKVPPVFE